MRACSRTKGARLKGFIFGARIIFSDQLQVLGLFGGWVQLWWSWGQLGPEPLMSTLVELPWSPQRNRKETLNPPCLTYSKTQARAATTPRVTGPLAKDRHHGASCLLNVERAFYKASRRVSTEGSIRVQA